MGPHQDIRHYHYPWFDRVLCNQSGPQEFHRYHHHNQDDPTDRHYHDHRGLFQNIRQIAREGRGCHHYRHRYH